VEGEAVIVAHISDLHLRSLRGVELSAFLSQRLVGGLNLLLNRGPEFPREVARALFDDLARVKPDHLIVSGDLSNLSLLPEFELARDLLRELPLEASDVTVVPGNHDAYTWGSWKRDAFGRVLGEFLASDAEGPTPAGRYPLLRLRDGVAIIALSTARPSLPAMAIGTLGEAQLRAAEALLAGELTHERFRIVVLHHPPDSPHLTWHKRLTDSRGFNAMIRRAGAELVLHGHLHRMSRQQLPSHGNRTVPLIGLTSSTWLSHDPERRARYNLYRLEGGRQGGFEVETRRYDEGAGGFVPLALRERFALEQC
jgi:3',5'-cyclic AMP phosphodiesterase CpdA